MAGCPSRACWSRSSPSSAPVPMASSATSRSMRRRRSVPLGARKALEEALGVLVADHPQARNLAALRVEEDDARRTEKREALEQRLVLLGVGGDVDLQQEHLVELRLHAR